MSIAWFDGSQTELAEALVRRISARTGSVFQVIGEDACRGIANAILTALRADLLSGKREAARAAVHSLVEDLFPKGLTFADLRHFAQSLRVLTLGAVEAAVESDGARRELDDWLFDLLMVSAMRFLAKRAQSMQEQAAESEVRQLETQIGELKAAVADKSRLLEIIRQASTPIAPVVEGILVVPLVGVFDAFRGALLTEKLLAEVSRTRARVVILDIAGVPVLDAEAAGLILRLSQAVRLLGAEMIIVGVSPAMACTMIELGVELHGLRTLRTLQDGLAEALVARRLKLVPL